MPLCIQGKDFKESLKSMYLVEVTMVIVGIQYIISDIISVSLNELTIEINLKRKKCCNSCRTWIYFLFVAGCHFFFFDK